MKIKYSKIITPIIGLYCVIFLPRHALAESIHQIQYENHQNTEILKHSMQSAFSANAIQALNGQVSARVQKQVFGFHPYWLTNNEYQRYRYDLLTTIAYFALELNDQGKIIDYNGWPDTALIEKAHANGVKVVVVVSNFNANQITSFLSDSDAQSLAIENILASIKNSAADGVNIDFENMDVSQRENFVEFITDLSLAFHGQSPALDVSIDVPAVDWSGAYNIQELADVADSLVIMGYDYHYKKSAEAGPVSPLESGSIWPWYNITNTVQSYIQESGGQPQKIILGLPHYGYDWKTNTNSVPAKSLGTGTAKTYAAIQDKIQSKQRNWDSNSKTPYVQYGSYHQIWYEDQESLKLKYDLVKSQNLAGIGIWALGYDDGYAALWEAIDQSFTDIKEGKILVSPATITAKNELQIKLFDYNGRVTKSFYPYGRNTQGLANSILGDINNDGDKEYIIAPGKKIEPRIKIFDSNGILLAEYLIYGKKFKGGVSIALGDINGDQIKEIITIPQSGGGPDLRILQYDSIAKTITQIGKFWPFDKTYNGGADIYCKDFNNDAIDEIIVSPKKGKNPEIQILSFKGNIFETQAAFKPYAVEIHQGVNVSVGDINNNSIQDIIFSPNKNDRAPVIAYEFNGQKMELLGSVFPYGEKFKGGITAVIGNYDGTGDSYVTFAPKESGGPNIRTFKFNPGAKVFDLVHWVWAYGKKFRGGVNIAAMDVNEDQKDELLVGPIQKAGPRLKIYNLESAKYFRENQSFWTFDKTSRSGIKFELPL